MGVRESLNHQNPKVVFGVTAGIIVIVAALLVSLRRSGNDGAGEENARQPQVKQDCLLFRRKSAIRSTGERAQRSCKGKTLASNECGDEQNAGEQKQQDATDRERLFERHVAHAY